ncbi:MAG TPA: alkaline phosphatase family protein [Actinomycetota bacterium]
MSRLPKVLLVFAVAGGAVALLLAWMGSLAMAVIGGLGVWLVGMVLIWWDARRGRETTGASDPSRRRLLAWAGLGGLAWIAGGTAIGRALGTRGRPDARAIQQAAATDLGAEYMELVARTYHQERAGEIQLLLAPFNSANYSNESLSLVPNDPRTSHASVWMYLERIPLVVYGPGIVDPLDSEDRVTLADLAPTTAELIGEGDWPVDREGRMLPGLTGNGTTPKVVVTFVIDGGGWNVLQQYPNDWPVLKGLMRGGANYRNAIQGSFPAVTACAHATIGTGTFPRQHGITGHNIRTPAGVRKTYGVAGEALPDDILLPTLADLWHDRAGAWVGQLGYQVWHLGMLGKGGTARAEGDLPVGVFWDENNGGGWAPHNPDLYRLPGGAPGLDVYEARKAGFQNPGWDGEFAPKGRQAPCCEPPIVEYQGDLIDAALQNEPIGEGATSLLYVNYKAPDYAGHIYGMFSEWEGLMVRSVDEQLGRLVDTLEARFGGEYVLFVTADHGQCPLPDEVGGVRLDPIQLERVIEEEFGPGVAKAVEYLAPAEIWIHTEQLWDSGATVDDIAAFLRHLTYRQNLGPYVPASAIEQAYLDKEEFAAVFGKDYLSSLGATDRFGPTVYRGSDVDPGIPTLD